MNKYIPSASSSSPNCSNGKQKRQILVIRHGERIDFTFNVTHNNWLEKAFASGKYQRFNTNMPRVLLQRSDGYKNYANDTPLTEIGYLQAKIVGRALKDAGIRIHSMYVSPAYRCVQTAVGLLKGMHNETLQLNIEPGLFEWGNWFKAGPPSWIPPAEYRENHSYPINTKYVSIVSEVNPLETIEDYYERSRRVVTRTIDSQLNWPDDGSYVVFVAHGASLDTCTRQLCGNQSRSIQDFYSVLHQTPYLAVACCKEFDASQKKWVLSEPPILPFEHQGNASYNWKILSTTT